MWFSQIVVVLVFCSITIAVDPVVDLGYSKYKGRIVGDGTTQWKGMRFAAPPLGELRFAKPQDPPKTTGIQDASQFGHICLPSDPTDWTTKPFDWFTIGEDCLFINVFAPSNATKRSRLPVMFFIQGGGFSSNSNANYNGSDLARNGNMVVVSINYRVGPYGFLQSKELDNEGSTNVGIRDQIKALEWVQDNISEFGGNPEHVVLNGDSAGASSLALLLTTPAIHGAHLFVGAISESGPYPVVRPLSTMQTQYNCLLTATGCSNATNPLTCLRSVNATKLMTTTCTFNAPYPDTEVAPQIALDAVEKGEWSKVPTIFGSTQNEGTDFVPQSINSTDEFKFFAKSLVPSLSAKSLQLLIDIYITNATEPVFPGAGKYWRNAANVITDAGFTCVDRLFQQAILKQKVKTWNYRYAVKDPEKEATGEGVPHTVELFAVWGPNNTDHNPPKSYLTSNAGIVPVVQHYWVSFIKHLNPNKERQENTPKWEAWDEARRRIGFVTDEGKGWAVQEKMDYEQDRRCRVMEPMIKAIGNPPPEGVETELVWVS